MFYRQVKKNATIRLNLVVQSGAQFFCIVGQPCPVGPRDHAHQISCVKTNQFSSRIAPLQRDFMCTVAVQEYELEMSCHQKDRTMLGVEGYYLLDPPISVKLTLYIIIIPLGLTCHLAIKFHLLKPRWTPIYYKSTLGYREPVLSILLTLKNSQIRTMFWVQFSVFCSSTLHLTSEAPSFKLLNIINYKP